MNELIFAFQPGSPAIIPKEQAVPAVKSAGFDGLEAPLHPDFIGTKGRTDYAALRDLLQSNGLAAPVVAASWAICSPGSEGEVGIYHGLDVLGSLLVSTVAVVRVEECAADGHDEAMKRINGALIAALNHCDPANIALAVELVDGGVLGSYSQAMDWLYLRHPDVGFAVDVPSFARTGEDPFRAVTELGTSIRMVYVGEPGSTTAVVDYSALFGSLKAIPYMGPIAVRTEASDPARLKRDLEVYRRLWNETPPAKAVVTES